MIVNASRTAESSTACCDRCAARNMAESCLARSTIIDWRASVPAPVLTLVRPPSTVWTSWRSCSSLMSFARSASWTRSLRPRLSRCATASTRRNPGSLPVAIWRQTSRPALYRCSASDARAPRVTGSAASLGQTSAVIGQPVTLWEVTGEHEAVPRATSDQSRTPRLDLEATLRRWNIPVPIGSRWVAAPGATSDAWVIAPVRSRPPAPPPQGRERRSKERLALELAGLALGLIDAPASHQTAALPPGILAHEASNPLTAARAGLELAMESVGRWVDLGADRRLALLDDLGQVLEDLDRTSEFL